MKEYEKKLYEDALNQWGRQAQIGMFYEEIGELMAALNKHGRNINGCDLEDVQKEIIDAQVMLDQLKVIYFESIEDFEANKGHKLSQLESYLEEELEAEK